MKQVSRDSSITDFKANFSPVFARHETFHPRFSWIKKGFDAARLYPAVFLQEDAPVRRLCWEKDGKFYSLLV